MRAIAVLMAVIGCLGGCATTRPAPPAQLGRIIGVLPPNNRTGDPLVVSGTGLIDRYLTHANRVTVPDVLLSEARFVLQQKGFVVTDRKVIDAALKGSAPEGIASALDLSAQGGLRDLVLYVEIRRWEPDAPVHTAFVIVGLRVSLIRPSTRELLWTEDRTAAPVPTPGELTRQSAYVTAARKVMAEMLAPLRPDPPAR